jgi:hypothetical protein
MLTSHCDITLLKLFIDFFFWLLSLSVYPKVITLSDLHLILKKCYGIIATNQALVRLNLILELILAIASF